ncbi:MAG: nucleotidyltransferase domain-containing protein, partial [Nocardioides sp.]
MVQWREVCPAEWQARVVEGALDVLPDAPGLVAAWLGGSLATGVADEYSDVDLNCLVEDTHMDAWREAWPSVVGRCAGPLVLANPIGGPVVGGYALTTTWEHVDLIVHARSTWSPPDPCRILHDPHALLTERLRPVAIGDPYYPDGLVTLFLYLAGNLVVTLGRGELVVAHAGV